MSRLLDGCDGPLTAISHAGSALGGGDWSGGSLGRGVRATIAPKAESAYSEATLRSLENIEEAQLNYDLVRGVCLKSWLSTAQQMWDIVMTFWARSITVSVRLTSLERA